MTTTIETISGLGYKTGLARKHTADPTTPDVYLVRGPEMETYVSIDPVTGGGMTAADQQAIDSLADPATRCEREFQHNCPDAAAARVELVTHGYTVERPDPNVEVFTIAGGKSDLKDIDPEGLIAQAGALPSLVPAPVPVSPVAPMPGTVLQLADATYGVVVGTNADGSPQVEPLADLRPVVTK